MYNRDLMKLLLYAMLILKNNTKIQHCKPLEQWPHYLLYSKHSCIVQWFQSMLWILEVKDNLTALVKHFQRISERVTYVPTAMNRIENVEKCSPPQVGTFHKTNLHLCEREHFSKLALNVQARFILIYTSDFRYTTTDAKWKKGFPSHKLK